MKDKVIFSYIGGSGCDMVASSLNGYDLDFSKTSAVYDRGSWSLKSFESGLDRSKEGLIKTVISVPDRFLATHLHSDLSDLPCRVYSVDFQNQEVADQVARRWAYLATRTISNNGGSSIYRMLLSYMTQSRFDRAADLFLSYMIKQWHDQNKTRRQERPSRFEILYFDKLFDPGFTESLEKQNVSGNLRTLEKNHESWLCKNRHLDQSTLLETIENKLQQSVITDQEIKIPKWII